MRYSHCPLLLFTVVLTVLSSHTQATRSCLSEHTLPDVLERVSIALSCNETSLQASLSIDRAFMPSALDGTGVEKVNLQYSCTSSNGSAIIPTTDLLKWSAWQSAQLHELEEVTVDPLPVGAVCRLSGCYDWTITNPLGETSYHMLPETHCIVAPPDTQLPQPTTSSSTVVTMVTRETADISVPVSTTHVTTVGVATTLHPSPAATLHTAVTRPSPSPVVQPDGDEHAESALADGLMAFFLTLCGGLLILCAVFLLIMLRVVQKTHHKSKQIDRKYFDDLRHFDSFKPVDPFDMLSVPSLPSLHTALTFEPTARGSCDPEPSDEGSGVYVKVGEPVSDSSDSTLLPGDMTDTLEQREDDLLSGKMSAVDVTSGSFSFDLMSLQSMDQFESQAPQGVILSETGSRARDYVDHSVLMV